MREETTSLLAQVRRRTSVVLGYTESFRMNAMEVSVAVQIGHGAMG